MLCCSNPINNPSLEISPIWFPLIGKEFKCDLTWVFCFLSVMLCYVTLCYVMLCYVTLCCFVLLCCVVLCYVISCCYIMLCYVTLCYVVLCYVTFRCVTLCYVVLCYVMLCYVMLCVSFYFHELSVLIVLYFTIFVLTESYLYFIIWYLDL